MTSDSPAAGKAASTSHEHQYHALWAHLGPHGRQDIHYHPCTEDEDEPWTCAAVLVGYGRECGGSEQPHVRTGLPLPDDLAIPGEPEGYEPFIAGEGWREETEIKFVPESAVAEAVTRERESCASLAESVGATYPFYERPGFISAHPPFADLLREDGDG